MRGLDKPTQGESIGYDRRGSASEPSSPKGRVRRDPGKDTEKRLQAGRRGAGGKKVCLFRQWSHLGNHSERQGVRALSTLCVCRGQAERDHI